MIPGPVSVAWVVPDRDGGTWARHVVGRALLRRVLADAWGCDPLEVSLRTDPRGQPRVDDGPDGWHVSVSHTEGLVVAAAARDHPVGVDVERSDRHPLPPDRLWLSAADRRRVDRAPPVEHHRQLVRCWTAKEAVAKARGVGMTLPLRTIEVGDAMAWTTTEPVGTWWLHDVLSPPTFTVTLAVAWSGVAPEPPAAGRDGAGVPQSAGEGPSFWNCPATMPNVVVWDHVLSLPASGASVEGQGAPSRGPGVPGW